MKRNLLTTFLSAGLLLAGGAVWAAGNAAPVKAAAGAPEGWVISPESGSATATLPNSADDPCQIITFTNEDWSQNVDIVDASKVSVTYAGMVVSKVPYPRDEEAGEDSNGFGAYPTDNYDGMQVIVNYQVFSEPGDLVIMLDEGAIYDFDGNESPAMTFTRSYGQSLEKQVSVKQFKPQTGSAVKTLSKVSIFFDLSTLGDEMALCDESKASEIKLVKNGSSEEISAESVAFDENAGYVEEAMAYTVVFPEVSEDGEYTMTVPAGFFWAGTEMGVKPEGAPVNSEITANYTVDSSVKGPFENYVVLDPAVAPTEITKLESVTIQFPDLEQVFGGGEEPTLTKDGQPSEYAIYVGKDWNYGMNALMLTFTIDDEDQVIRENGLYEINFPAGSISNGAETNTEAFSIAFKVNNSAPVSYSWTSSPANGGKIEFPAEDDSFIDFSFALEGADELDIHSEWTDPDYDPNQPGGHTAKAITVTYGGQSVAQVANAYGDEVENKGYQLRAGWDGNDFSIRVNRQVFNRPGVLEITIDKGKFLVDGTNPSPALNYSCTVGEIPVSKDYETRVLPEAEAGVEYSLSDFNEITVQFVNATSAELRTHRDLDDDDKPIQVPDEEPTLKIGGVYYYGDVDITKDETAECPSFVFKFSDLNEYDNGLGGTMSLSLAKGMFTLDGDQDSPAVYAAWPLKRTKEIDTNYTLSPQGDIVNQGYGIFPAFAFSSEEYISCTGACTVKLNGEVIDGISPKVQNWAVSFELTSAQFMDKDLTGTLEITLPAGSVSVSGVELGEISHTWNIVLPKEFQYHFIPEFAPYSSTDELPMASDLSEIVIEFVDAESVRVWNDNYINLRSKDYFTYSTVVPTTEVITSNGMPAVKMSFDPAPSVATVYELAFNYGAFYIDNAYDSPSMNYLVNFDKESGVKLVGADANGEYTVYTLDGRMVAKGGFDAVKNLEKGVYIVNGKKIIF